MTQIESALHSREIRLDCLKLAIEKAHEDTSLGQVIDMAGAFWAFAYMGYTGEDAKLYAQNCSTSHMREMQKWADRLGKEANAT
jgi:hypothetical protein